MVINSFFELSGRDTPREDGYRAPAHPAILHALRSLGITPGDITSSPKNCEDLMALGRRYGATVSESNSITGLLVRLSSADRCRRLGVAEVIADHPDNDITLLIEADAFGSLTLTGLGNGAVRLGVERGQLSRALRYRRLRHLVLLRRCQNGRAPGR